MPVRPPARPRRTESLAPLRVAALVGALLVVAGTAPATAGASETGAAAAAEPGPPAAAASGERAAARDPDPFERLNRATFAFNDALDRMLARPAARAYRRVVPEPGRIAVSNFVSNLEYPTTFVNSALQGKFVDAGQGVARFVVNSTVGLAGFFDPATNFGIPRHDEDLGQTLGRWGVPAGPYLVLPAFGPSTVRDTPTRWVDRYTNVRHYVGPEDGIAEFGLLGLDLVDRRTQLLAADPALEAAFDPYALVRGAFLQRREFQVRDGDVPEPDYDDLYEEPVEEIPIDAPAAPPAG